MTLAEFLKSSGKSQSEFADLLGVSQVAVMRYANGSREPSFETIRKIHEITGGKVGPDDFVFPVGGVASAGSVKEPTP
jgi:transcriptional regulator with XRE-family HTH domain